MSRTPDLTPAQAKCVNDILTRFRESVGRHRSCTLALPPGRGKTRVAGAVIHRLSQSPLPNVGMSPGVASSHTYFPIHYPPHNNRGVCVMRKRNLHQQHHWWRELREWSIPGTEVEEKKNATVYLSIADNLPVACETLEKDTSFQLLVVDDADLLTTAEWANVTKCGAHFSYVLYIYSGLHRVGDVHKHIPEYTRFTQEQARSLVVGDSATEAEANPNDYTPVLRRVVLFTNVVTIDTQPELRSYLSQEKYTELCLAFGAHKTDDLGLLRSNSILARETATFGDFFSPATMKKKLQKIHADNKRPLETHCTVCFDPPGEVVLTDCGHTFCPECIFTWLAQGGVETRFRCKTCPVCRYKLSFSSLTVLTEKRSPRLPCGVVPTIARIVYGLQRPPWNSKKNMLVVCPHYDYKAAVYPWKSRLLHKGIICHDLHNRTPRAIAAIFENLRREQIHLRILFVRDVALLQGVDGLHTTFDKLVFLQPCSDLIQRYVRGKLDRLRNTPGQTIFEYFLRPI